ncbi:MAG: peptide chain release factor 1 [Ruminococcaceae bacterium]|nr:peptide chain release factor 1 [Oscillospiraceae bacterium]
MSVTDKLVGVEERYKAIEAQLGDPSLISDQKAYAAAMREYKNLTPIIEKYKEFLSVEDQMHQAKELLDSSDSDIHELAQEEYYSSRDKLEVLTGELVVLLLPKDENDDKNVIVEIRAGAGGEEAALFAAVLYRMYSMYAASKRFRVSPMNMNETELGGFREITFMIEGEGAYSRFKFESGVHRVQRVPETESQGRIHTSTVTVAVLPEAEDVEIEINPADIIMESCKSSGAGGQHINKTESAVRLTHKPSGIVVECQQERSQLQNREKALQMLKAKLYDIKQTEQAGRIASERKSQIGTGDRSERIRTYNYPQGRITDHRIGLSVFNMEAFLNGEIDDMIDTLISADTAEKLKNDH